MVSAQGSQLDTSFFPDSQMGWLQDPPPPPPPPPPVQTPEELQVSPLAQLPQVPPQPSLPQVFPEQLGVQLETHCPELLQDSPPVHVPQVPPQPSLPHIFPVQFGVQVPPPPRLASAAPFGVPLPVGPS